MARKNAKEIRRGQNRVKDYKPKGRKRPSGWHKRKWLPIRKLMRELKAVKPLDITAYTEGQGTSRRVNVDVGKAENPYPQGTNKYYSWNQGWNTHFEESWIEEDWTEELEHDD